MAEAPLLRAEAISKTYGDGGSRVEVLRDLSFAISAEESCEFTRSHSLCVILKDSEPCGPRRIMAVPFLNAMTQRYRYFEIARGRTLAMMPNAGEVGYDAIGGFIVRMRAILA